MEKEFFTSRISSLRAQKGISARDMSLSLGQSQSYINSLEKGIYYPSMTAFFDICAYFGVTPKDFFDDALHCPAQIQKLISIAAQLDEEQLELLISLAKGLVR